MKYLFSQFCTYIDTLQIRVNFILEMGQDTSLSALPDFFELHLTATSKKEAYLN